MKIVYKTIGFIGGILFILLTYVLVALAFQIADTKDYMTVLFAFMFGLMSVMSLGGGLAIIHQVFTDDLFD